MASRSITGPTSTEDLLDQLVAEDRMNQRVRKELYREQLQQDIQRHHQQKEIVKMTSKMELEQLYNNMKRTEQLERQKYHERRRAQKETLLANQAILGNTRQSVEVSPRGRSIIEQLNDHNAVVLENRRQRQGIQDQMNAMQQKIKRENDQRQHSQRMYEEQKHLSQMESYVERRQKDKQNRLERHRQNMRVYEEIGKMQDNQDKEKEHIQSKFETDKLAEGRARAREQKSEEQRRKKEQVWLKGVERQLEEKNQMKEVLNQQKRYERELMDSINLNDGNHRDKAYLRELEVQIKAEKSKRRQQHNDRFGINGNGEAPTRMSPALLGKVPASYERQRQLELIDRQMGFVGPKRIEFLQPVTPQARNMSREDASQQRELHQLKQKLNASRDFNTVRQSTGVAQQPYRSTPATPRVQSHPVRIADDPGLQSRSSNRSNSPQNSDQPANRMSRSMKMYDFITGRNIVYNMEQ